MTHETCMHEEQIQELSSKTAELEAKNGFKEQRINELIEDNRRIESKIDNLTNTVNDVVVKSIKDDNDLKEEVIKLRTKIETQERLFTQYQKKAREHREEDRVKTNQYLGYITAGVCVLTFVLTYVFH